MAGHDDGHRIIVIGLPHGAEAARRAYLPGNISIRAGLTVRNLEQRLPAAFLKLRSPQIERKGKLFPAAGKIFFQLSDISSGLLFRLDPLHLGPPVAIETWLAQELAAVQIQQNHPLLRNAYIEHAYGGLQLGVVKSFHNLFSLL